MRKPYQGVLNIIRFNWHFYLIALVVIIASLLLLSFLPESFRSIVFWLTILGTLPILISLIVSYYIYDLSGLYQLSWIPQSKTILNVNAGFDETSDIIQAKFPNCQITTCDFYDPKLHTEVSIKRARKAYPPKTNNILVSTDHLPFSDNAFDTTLAILSAHEIRDEAERIIFFKELKRVTKPNGQICVTEHLRNLNNFFAYTIGFLHFHSKSSWLNTFEKSNLIVKQEIKATPFITTFILDPNGNTL